MRRAAFAVLMVLGAVSAAVAYWAGVATIACAVAAKSVHPTHRRGNCWLHALYCWWHRGGGVYVRAADGIRIGRLPVPHVAWVGRLGSDAVVEQYTTDDPLPRSGLSGIWFHGSVRGTERDGAVRGHQEQPCHAAATSSPPPS